MVIIALVQLSYEEINMFIELTVHPFELKSDKQPNRILEMKFISSDSEELKNLEFTFKGDKTIFKVGENSSNHFQIPNDKKLLESQFMILSINGEYYIKDLGFVHHSRLKVDLGVSI